MAAKRGATGGGKGRTRRAPGGALTGKQIVGRAVVFSGALAVVVFAIQGGEYGTTDLVRQHRQLIAERAAVESLEAEVERLTAYRKLVEGDAATQERIAREEFGMVKGEKEILYRFVEPARR